MKTYLKIKIAGLVGELRALKRERKRYQPRMIQTAAGVQYERRPIEVSLTDHYRKVHTETRAANLALGFLRGRPYSTMESYCLYPPDWARVEHNVYTFGNRQFVNGKEVDGRITAQKFAEWLAGAKDLTNPKSCKARRFNQAQMGRKRKAAYRAKYQMDAPKETQLELKARLKEKWLGEQNKS